MTTVGDAMFDLALDEAVKVNQAPVTPATLPTPQCLPAHEQIRKANYVTLLWIATQRKKEKEGEVPESGNWIEYSKGTFKAHGKDALKLVALLVAAWLLYQNQNRTGVASETGQEFIRRIVHQQVAAAATGDRRP